MIVPEALASLISLSHGLKSKVRESVEHIVDMGAGTTDIALAKCSFNAETGRSLIQILVYKGLNFGGNAFDQK